MEKKLYARLKTVAANVYPLVAPKAYSLPCAVYTRIITDATRDIGDDLNETAYLTFQIDSYASTLDAAKALALAIRTALKTWNDDTVQGVAWVAERDSVDNTTDNMLFRVSTDCKFFCDL
jgi:hypothetical protein